MKSGAYWDKSPSDYGEAIHAMVREKTRDTALAVYHYCIDHSPVDTGAYRASWTLTEGYPQNNWVGRQRRNGSVLSPPITPRISTKFYRELYISNGAPYAERIEYGWSDQAPLGVLRQAMRYVS